MIYSILSGAIREDNNKQINLQIYYGGHRSYAMKNCLQGQFKQTPSTTILFCTRFLVAFLFYWTSASICHVWIHFCFQNIQVKIIINRNNRNPYIKRYKTQHFKEHFKNLNSLKFTHPRVIPNLYVYMTSAKTTRSFVEQSFPTHSPTDFHFTKTKSLKHLSKSIMCSAGDKSHTDFEKHQCMINVRFWVDFSIKSLLN